MVVDDPDPCRDLHRPRDQRLPAGRVLIATHFARPRVNGAPTASYLVPRRAAAFRNGIAGVRFASLLAATARKPHTAQPCAIPADAEHMDFAQCSPDLRPQVQANARCKPRAGPRGSPIAAVVLTGAEVDQTRDCSRSRRQNFNYWNARNVVASRQSGHLMRARRSADTVALQEPSSVEKQPFDLPGGLPAELFADSGNIAALPRRRQSAARRRVRASMWAGLSSGTPAAILYVPGRPA